MVHLLKPFNFFSMLLYVTIGSAVFASVASSAPTDINITSMVEIFKQVCIQQSGDPEKIGALSEPSALEYEAQTISAGNKESPYLVHKWTAPGITISQHGHFLNGFENQCNASFRVSSLPPPLEIASVLEKALGSQPTNRAEAFKKNGKPNKRFKPEWSIVDGNGKPIKIIFNALDLSSLGKEKRVQLSAIMTLPKQTKLR